MKGLRKSGDWLEKKVARESNDGIAWVGWIRGHRRQKKQLRRLGVRGAMMWSLHNPYGGIFEYCICDTATMERLLKEYPLFWSRTFTGVDIDGNQLPRERQVYGARRDDGKPRG